MSEECRVIGRKLWILYRSSSIIIAPNYIPKDWFECDLFRVTKSLYAYEYEIKISIEDYRADFKKHREFYVPTWHTKKKHWFLRDGDRMGCPNYFFYVVTRNLAERIERDRALPEYAGLIVFDRRLITVKPAPRIHKNRQTKEQLLHAASSCMWRFCEQRFAA